MILLIISFFEKVISEALPAPIAAAATMNAKPQPAEPTTIIIIFH